MADPDHDAIREQIDGWLRERQAEPAGTLMTPENIQRGWQQMEDNCDFFPRRHPPGVLEQSAAALWRTLRGNNFPGPNRDSSLAAAAGLNDIGRHEGPLRSDSPEWAKAIVGWRWPFN